MIYFKAAFISKKTKIKMHYLKHLAFKLGYHSKSKLLLASTALIISCSALNQKKNCKSGVVLYTTRVLDQESDVYVYPEITADRKTLYYGDYIIQPVPIARIFEESDNYRRQDDTLFYAFLDLDKRNYFNYLNFSDTAQPIQCCYTTTDSAGINGGWNFFYKPLKSIYAKLESNSDTVIENTRFKRISVFINNRDTTSTQSLVLFKIYYLNLSRKGSPFTLNHFLSDSLGYPVTRMDLFDKYRTTGKSFTWIEKIEFVSDRLSPFEQKVFTKWIKTARKNPIKFDAARDSIFIPKY